MISRLAKIVLLLAVVFCQACSSEFIAKTLYNNLDDSYADSIAEYATFDKAQRGIIKQAAEDFARWHRSTQLEQYQLALREVSSTLDALTSVKEVRAIGDQIETFGEQISDQAWPALLPLFDTVTPEQADEISASLDEKLEDWRKDHNKRQKRGTPAEPHKESLKQIKKMFRRALGIKLTVEQLALFEPALEQGRSLELLALGLEHDWNAQFVELLRQQKNSDSRSAILQHMSDGSRLLRDNYPDQVEANTLNFSQGLTNVINSLSDVQRNAARKRLGKYDQILQTLIDDQ